MMNRNWTPSWNLIIALFIICVILFVIGKCNGTL
jgi:hypothetical protein